MEEVIKSKGGSIGNKGRGTDVDKDMIPDVLEQNKIALDNVKHSREIATKQKEASDKKEIELKKIALKEKEIKSKERIQKSKDAAAEKRERIKGRIQLKNRTSGEK